MPETLLTCPDCGQPNFTPRGLTGHRKSKHCAQTKAEKATTSFAGLAQSLDGFIAAAPSAKAKPSAARPVPKKEKGKTPARLPKETRAAIITRIKEDWAKRSADARARRANARQKGEDEEQTMDEAHDLDNAEDPTPDAEPTHLAYLSVHSRGGAPTVKPYDSGEWLEALQSTSILWVCVIIGAASYEAAVWDAKEAIRRGEGTITQCGVQEGFEFEPAEGDSNPQSAIRDPQSLPISPRPSDGSDPAPAVTMGQVSPEVKQEGAESSVSPVISCSKTSGTRVLTLDALEALPPVVVGPPNPDAEMSADVTAQYHRATGGMVEVLKFGAMLMQLEEGLDSARLADGNSALGIASEPIDSKCGINSRGAGRYEKGTGLKAWLETHCPAVKISTAWRFLTITKGVAADHYPKLVGPKVAKKYTLPKLVNTAPAELPEPAREKQEALFDFVRGTSQRSWLDGLKGQAAKGGKTYEREDGKGAIIPPTVEQVLADLRQRCIDAAETLRAIHADKAWRALDLDAELDGLINHTAEVARAAEEWRQKPRAKREETIRKEVEKLIKDAAK
jgi:hypothetical protein